MATAGTTRYLLIRALTGRESLEPCSTLISPTMNTPPRPNRPRKSGDAPQATDLARSEERLGRALSTALNTGRATPSLREAIAEFVRAAKDGGFSWRDTAASVNALMRQAATRQTVTADVDALAERILGWCEEEYANRG